MQDMDAPGVPPAERGRLLRTALLANAAYSGLAGATIALTSPGLGEVIGLNGWVVFVVGLGLVGYAVLLTVARGHQQILRAVGRAAVGADLLWIVGAAILIGIGDVLTGPGNLGLAIVSAGVGVVAVTQWLGLKRLGGG